MAQVIGIPREADVLNNSSDMNIPMGVHEWPKLIRTRDINERQECDPLSAILKRLREDVCSLQSRLDIAELHIRSSRDLMKPVDLNTCVRLRYLIVGLRPVVKTRIMASLSSRTWRTTSSPLFPSKVDQSQTAGRPIVRRP